VLDRKLLGLENTAQKILKTNERTLVDQLTMRTEGEPDIKAYFARETHTGKGKVEVVVELSEDTALSTEVSEEQHETFIDISTGQDIAMATISSTHDNDDRQHHVAFDNQNEGPTTELRGSTMIPGHSSEVLQEDAHLRTRSQSRQSNPPEPGLLVMNQLSESQRESAGQRSKRYAQGDQGSKILEAEARLDRREQRLEQREASLDSRDPRLKQRLDDLEAGKPKLATNVGHLRRAGAFGLIEKYDPKTFLEEHYTRSERFP
jgi:hypothetical protein